MTEWHETRDRPMSGLCRCCDCLWLMSWPLYPDWKEHT